MSTRAGKVTALACVGGALSCGGRQVSAPETVHGEIIATDPENDSLTIHVDDARMQLAAGQRLLVRNERFITPSVYTLQKVEQIDGDTWRVEVDMPFLLARGVVGRVDAAHGAFASRTPVMKLRVNPGLFDGKRVQTSLAKDAPEYLLTSARESAFVLAEAQGLHAFPAGSSYVVLDVGLGDHIELIGSAEKSFK